jgi:hypothetical protein
MRVHGVQIIASNLLVRLATQMEWESDKIPLFDEVTGRCELALYIKYTCIHIYVYIYMYIYMHIYIYMSIADIITRM